MKNNKLLILVGLVVLGLGVFIIYDSQTKEEPSFKPVELKQENSVINGSLPSYYDTIVNVGLELVGIEGVTVTIEELPEEVKKTFNGELNAHVRYLDGRFYLFIDPLNKRKAITVISHEIVHMRQYLDGTFKYDDGRITWNGRAYLLEDITYDDRPWETEAFQLEGQLASQISEVVYQ
jgi:hypothetical protein